MTDGYTEDRIRSVLEGKRFGSPLHFFEVVDSTQRVALELAEGGAPEGTLVVADGQTAGKGRRGRVWHSPGGKGICLSLLLKPRISSGVGGLLSAWAGLAVLGALKSCGFGGLGAGIKWPNDVLVDGCKLCGILIDGRTVGDELVTVVVGVGLNVNQDASDFPPDIAGTATSLKIAGGRTSDRELLLGRILAEMERTYGKALEKEGRAAIASEAEQASVLLGKRVIVDSPRGALSGIAKKIDPDGALVLEPGTGSEERILTGDVEMVSVREERR